MPITRRSLLQSLGALPAAWYLRAFAAGQKRTACTITKPAPNSAFVLLEGPWLLFPKNDDPKKLIALSLPPSIDDDPCATHYCFFQAWNCGSVQPRPHGEVEVDKPLTITASKTPPGDFSKVFNAAFDQYPFVWADSDSSAQIKHSERYLYLQIPSQVHIAGRLNDFNLSTTGYKQPLQGTVMPHVTTILQYDPPSGGDVSLEMSGPTSHQFGPADQIVFSMYHWAPAGDSDQTHMNHTTKFLTSYFSGDGKGIQITYNSAKYDKGDEDGFSEEELGLQQPAFVKAQNHPKARRPKGLPAVCAMSGEYSNCCGGSIVGGGN